MRRSRGLVCECSGPLCPAGAPNGTCVTQPGGYCFVSVEEALDDNGLLVYDRSAGCLPADESGFMQCKSSQSPHQHPKTIECCSSGDLCNRRLRAVLTGDDSGPVAETPRRQAPALAAAARRLLRLRLGPAAAGAAHRGQADPDGRLRRQGPLRRGVAGAVARGARRRQGVLHHRGGVLVPRDRDLPDGADAARERARVHRGRHQGHRLLDADAAHHRLPRKGLAVRLLADGDARPALARHDGALDRERTRAPAHGHLRHEGQAGHRAPRRQEQEHPREARRALRHRGLRAGRALRGRARRGGHRAQRARGHAPVHAARGAGRQPRPQQLRRVPLRRRVLARARAVGDVSPMCRGRRRGRAARGALRAALPRVRTARPQLRADARVRGGARRAAGRAGAVARRGAAGRRGGAAGGVLAREPGRAAHGAARQKVAGAAPGAARRQARVTASASQ